MDGTTDFCAVGKEVYAKTPLFSHFVSKLGRLRHPTRQRQFENYRMVRLDSCNSSLLNSSNSFYARLLAPKSFTLAMVTRR